MAVAVLGNLDITPHLGPTKYLGHEISPLNYAFRKGIQAFRSRERYA
jgi:hypothetical protein